jgi:hypothetical protein
VTPLLVVLLVVVILTTVAAGKGAGRHDRAGSSRRRAASGRVSPYWFVAAIVLGVVMLRFGMNAIVVAGGMLLAVLRGLLPLVRLLPLFESLRRHTVSDGGRAGPGSARPDGNGSPRRPTRMTRAEALQVFGLDESATREDVQREYRRLMRQVHPDLGGSSYLAAKLNEAKDVLS